MRAAAVPGRLAGALAVAVGMSWRNHRGAFCGLLVTAAIAGLAPVAAAWLLRTILDEIASRQRLGELLTLAVGLGAAGGLSAILPRVNAYLSAQSARAVQRDATDTLFSAVNRLHGLRTLEDPAFHDELRFAQQAGASGPGMVLSAGITITQSAITLAGFMVMLTVLSPVLAALLASSVVPAVFLERRSARSQAAVLRGITHAQRRQLFYADLLTSITVAKEIRLFGLGAFFRDRMLTELAEVQRSSAEADRRVLAADAILAALTALAAGGAVLWIVAAAARGQFTVGDVSMLVAAFTAASATLGSIIASATVAYQALLMFGSYRQVLAARPDFPVPATPTAVRGLRRGIEIADVWFRYGTSQPWVLRGLSCHIPRGHAVALVGENGAGKSTLVKLLCRFYDPDAGRILWDGTDLRDIDPAALRERICAVFQDYMTYELSAADNIAVGDLSQSADLELLHAAARQAGIHDTLASLPKGYQTMLTRSFADEAADETAGVLLSGGQWQRVALARAFLRGGRDLMIMDEPSAGLDARAEYDLHQRLALSRRGRTSLLISHRLNTIRDADHIVVLSGGVISEQGSHDDLMRHGGTYAKLFSLQARGYAAGLVSAGAKP